MHRRSLLVLPLLLAGPASHGKPPAGKPAPPPPIQRLREVKEGIKERAGLVLERDAYGDSATRLVYLDQGWGPAETVWFYHADQGSVLLPYDTLVHLEQAGSQQPFIHPEHLARFRLLNQRKTPNNPDALPVGFARHDDKVGLTCAACHTAQINYRGTALRIDGAPALADIASFIQAIRDAVAATLADEAKLARFAAAVPGGGREAKDREAARKGLQETRAWFDSYLAANRASTPEGFARLDAVVRIINQVIRFTSDPRHSIPPNAPASFPLLWDAPRHDYVQWTGFSPNAGAGSLGRNAGEVVGVFAHVEVKRYETEEQAKKGYPSTINAPSLVVMEESLRRLKSPRWPENILPPIDRKLAARGQALYEANCQSCHALIKRDDPRRAVVAMITGADVVGTDPTAAQDVASARIPTGVLQGAISPQGQRYGADAPALALLADLATRTVAAHPVAAAAAIANAKIHRQEKTPKQGKHDPKANLFAYKARPLNGIWASAPYLHNGSVPTLYDLLLPAAERPKKFSVGRLEYDPRKVGYVSDGEVPFVLDTSLGGNSSRGHEYGTRLSDAERWALVEYLKTL